MNKFGRKIFEDRYAAFLGETWEQAAERIGEFIFPDSSKNQTDTVQYVGKQWFIPAGRILKSANVDNTLTGYNCYVIPSPKDSREGIVNTLGEMIEIMSHGGGVGISLATLRPRTAKVKGVDGKSSGAVSWGTIYSNATGLIEQGGSRRGALMLTLPIWHPDIVEFITIKKQPGKMENANLSVMVTDDFMEALESEDDSWELKFPDTSHPNYHYWNGHEDYEGPWIVYDTVSANAIWNLIIQSAWESAEPGVLFWDEIERDFAGKGASRPEAVNPCAEQPLPAYGVCNLGHINLSEMYDENYVGGINYIRLANTTNFAVEFLDTLIDKTNPVLHRVAARQQRERRIGVGIMGFHDLLLKKGIKYGSEESLDLLEQIMEVIQSAAVESSMLLAREKGKAPAFSFDNFEKSKIYKEYLDKAETEPYYSKMLLMIKKHGLRNLSLLTIAPTGTIGTMLDVSTGIEPYFSFAPYERVSRLGKELVVPEIVEELGEIDPDLFVSAYDLTPEQHLEIVALAQVYVDSSISKTINMPAESTIEDVDLFYRKAYNSGVKGVTIYRDGSRQEQILSVKTCEICGGRMQQQEGCYTCTSCGSSFCSV